MQTFTQFISEAASDTDKIHKKAEMRDNSPNSPQEISHFQGTTIVTTDDRPDYKRYDVHGHMIKGAVHHSYKSGASIVHHKHDLKKNSGIAGPSTNALIKAGGRFEVRYAHPMQLPPKVAYFKTATEAKKSATEHAKQFHEDKKGIAKAGASMSSHRNFSQGPYVPPTSKK